MSNEQRVRLTERLVALRHTGLLVSLTVVLAAQFMYINFHYVLGGLLTILGLVGIVFEVGIGLALYSAIWQHRHLDEAHIGQMFHAQFIVNQLIILSFIPFFIWAVVLMFEHYTATLNVQIVT